MNNFSNNLSENSPNAGHSALILCRLSLGWNEFYVWFLSPHSFCPCSGGAGGSVVWGVHQEEKQECVGLLPGAGGWGGVLGGVWRRGASAGGASHAANARPQRLEGISNISVNERFAYLLTFSQKVILLDEYLLSYAQLHEKCFWKAGCPVHPA